MNLKMEKKGLPVDIVDGNIHFPCTLQHFNKCWVKVVKIEKLLIKGM